MRGRELEGPPFEHSTGIILPFAPEEINPNLDKKEKHRRLSRRDGSAAYNELLKAYLPAIIYISSGVYDPRAVEVPLEEKIVLGMGGLNRAPMRYRTEENEPDPAVFYSVRDAIRRGVFGERNKHFREAEQTVLIDDLTLEADHRPPFLEIIVVEQETPEDEVCDKLGLSQFFQVAASSYRGWIDRDRERTNKRIKGIKAALKRSKLLRRLSNQEEKRLQERLRRRYHQKAALTRKSNLAERNLVIFYFGFMQRYHYGWKGGPYPDGRLAQAFGLTTQRAQGIYHEVKDVILANPEVRIHLAEMLGLSLEEVEEKI